MKRCYLVCGPEGAGNRLLASILVRAGCHGEGATSQPYADRLPDGEEPVVVIRSLPHGGEWPDMAGEVRTLHGRGYLITLLVTARDPFALARSQISDGHAESERAVLARAAAGYRKLFSALPSDLLPVVVPYEALVLGGEAAASSLLTMLGLPSDREGPLTVEGVERDGITNENAKHYAEAVV